MKIFRIKNKDKEKFYRTEQKAVKALHKIFQCYIKKIKCKEKLKILINEPKMLKFYVWCEEGYGWREEKYFIEEINII